jgi:DNA replication protein DnaC
VIASAAPPLAVDLVESLRRLRLATMREQAPEVLQTAMTQRWSAEEVLRSLLQAEITAREAANRRIRLKQGGFPVLKTLEAFKVADSSIPGPTFEYIASLEWVRAQENLLLIGPPDIPAHYLSFSISLGK